MDEKDAGGTGAENGSPQRRSGDVLAWIAAIVGCLAFAGLGSLGIAWTFDRIARTSVSVRMPETEARIPVRQSLEACGILELEAGEAARLQAHYAHGMEGETAIGQPARWKRQPAPEYPRTAMRMGLREGRARVTCLVSAEGRPEACRIVDEQPKGAGFGEAALLSMCEAEFHPPKVDEETRTGWVNFNVTFRMPD